MKQIITGRRQIAPEYGVTNSGKDYAKTIIAVDLGGYTKLVHVFTMEEKSIAALKHFNRGDYLTAQGELTEIDYVTQDGREERLLKIPFATGLAVIPKKRRAA